MKIGLSYSRCVRDIVDGVVDIKDVLVVITRTDFDPTVLEQWKSIWEGYHWMNPEWGNYPDEDEIKFFEVTMQLWNAGKLHQPRKFGARPQRRSEIWLEAVLPDSELDNNPTVKAAWEQFQVLAGLAGSSMDTKYQ